MLVDIENAGRPVATVKGADNSSVKSTGQIGADFRALRRARGWTLSELAEQLIVQLAGCLRWNAVSQSRRSMMCA